MTHSCQWNRHYRLARNLKSVFKN